MKNRQVKQMMIDVENAKHGMRGYKTIETHGWHGFDESGLSIVRAVTFYGCTKAAL
ncbi:hypothetical protein ACNO5E_13395 [Vibrio parahaemolyticus]|uniref:hypothetical protein n=1 Tax=Vibrio parahaemolyticus TaxID=670 RepID=UPI0013010B17|nr:hypothetical protein [Vibrio parahaemolyticus]